MSPVTFVTTRVGSVPAHPASPVQPVKRSPATVAAVNVTVPPLSTVHDAPVQEAPADVDVTVGGWLPPPDTLTVATKDAAQAKLAATVSSSGLAVDPAQAP